MDKKTLLTLAVTKALALTENGGTWPKDSSKGKTGEMKSIYQFTPDTWKKYSGEILGDPNTPITPDSEASVVAGKTKKWLDKGFTPPQIASMWNAGEGEPDAYTGKFSDGKPSVGINQKYGVKFDVPTYAKTVEAHTVEIYKKLLSEQGGNNPPQNITYNKP